MGGKALRTVPGPYQLPHSPGTSEGRQAGGMRMQVLPAGRDRVALRLLRERLGLRLHGELLEIKKGPGPKLRGLAPLQLPRESSRPCSLFSHCQPLLPPGRQLSLQTSSPPPSPPRNEVSSKSQAHFDFLEHLIIT